MKGVNGLPKAVTRQRRGCDLNPGPSAPESSTLTTRHDVRFTFFTAEKLFTARYVMSTIDETTLLRCRHCRIKVGATDAAASGPFKKQARGSTDEITRKVFSVLVVISLVNTISGKSLKLLPSNVIF